MEEVGHKISYVHKVRMGEREIISVFSKRNLLDLFLSFLSLNCTVTLC